MLHLWKMFFWILSHLLIPFWLQIRRKSWRWVVKAYDFFLYLLKMGKLPTPVAGFRAWVNFHSLTLNLHTNFFSQYQQLLAELHWRRHWLDLSEQGETHSLPQAWEGLCYLSYQHGSSPQGMFPMPCRGDYIPNTTVNHHHQSIKTQDLYYIPKNQRESSQKNTSPHDFQQKKVNSKPLKTDCFTKVLELASFFSEFGESGLETWMLLF